MAGDERPDLELPSFLGGRRKQSREPAPQPVTDGAAPGLVTGARTPSSTDGAPVVEGVAQRPSRDLPPGLAVVATGLVAGLVAALLLWLAGLGCEAARGTSSCGGGLGFVGLVLVLAVTTVASWALLRLWRVPQPVGTAVLALGLLTVAALLVIDDDLAVGWLFVALPSFSLVTHLVAHAVAGSHVH